LYPQLLSSLLTLKLQSSKTNYLRHELEIKINYSNVKKHKQRPGS